MLYGLLVTLFSFVCLILILLVLVQKGKSSMGLGNLGGGTQLLFGGSGGQDLFQKITWALGAIFMAGSLILAMIKIPEENALINRLAVKHAAQEVPVPSAIPQVPAATPETDAKNEASAESSSEPQTPVNPA